MPASEQALPVSFARRLASNENNHRTSALRKLRHFLCRREQLAHLEMMQIWKGLFYCFWASDRVPVQQDLALRMALITLQLDDSRQEQPSEECLASMRQSQNALAQLGADEAALAAHQVSTTTGLDTLPRSLLYFHCFLSTMQREYGGIDHLRLDKYMSLVRRFLAAGFTLMSRHSFAQQWCALLMQTMQQCVLSRALEQRGLFLHVCDIFLTELRRSLGSCELKQRSAVTQESVLLILQPFVTILGNAKEKPLHQRVRKEIFESLLNAAQHLLQSEDAASSEDEDDVARGERILARLTIRHSEAIASRLQKCASKRSVARSIAVSRAVSHSIHARTHTHPTLIQ